MFDHRTIEQLRAAEKRIHQRIAELRASIEPQLTAAEADLKNIRGTIEYCEREVMEAGSLGPEVSNSKEFSLRGLTQKQAVVVIAKHNNGIVKSTEAKKLMIKAGIMAETKNSYRMARNAIITSGLFDSVTPGVYRLKEDSQLPIRAEANHLQ